MNIPSKCPECGSENIRRFDEPGYDHEGQAVPDWSCDACGVAGFDTADRQEDAYRNLKDAQKEYLQDTGFVKPSKPPVIIKPDYLDRPKHISDVAPEVLVNDWVCRNINKDSLTCPVCQGTIPIAGILNGDCFYEPDWTPEMFEEMEPRIQQTFQVKDALADFFICQNCFNAGGQLAPRPWLQRQASLPKYRTIDNP